MENIPGLQEFEDRFKALLLNKPLQKVALLNVNQKYMAFDPDRIWVLDGGCQFTFEDGLNISYCWNKEMELMEMIEGDAGKLMEELDFYEIEDVSQKVNTQLAGKSISSVEFEWNWYQKMDDNFELEDELHFAPLGMILSLEDNTTLQLAAVQFSVENDMSLYNAQYLPEGDLLVSLNQNIDVIMPGE